MASRDETGGKQVARADGGRFAPGSSGNPRGRPAGSRDQRTVLLEELVDDDGHVIIRKLLDSARAGEPWAVQLVIGRLLPAGDRRVVVDLPRVEKAGDVAAAVADVVGLAAEGVLTMEEAGGFLRLLEFQRRSIETSDLAVRMELLEESAAAEAKARHGARYRRGEE